ncbi:MAG: 50S ribosomal protein L5 [Ignavibacteriae bacterium]|nr:50S ribosomal protein L5 [Ignavibacteria bacterium]MBI3364474.1 50S ribosomal protein L5 [Ignavibacteriota bacterium]
MGKDKGRKAAAKEAKQSAATEQHVEEKGTTPRLEEMFRKHIIKQMMERFNYSNVMQVPRMEKISVNVGVGQATQDAKLLDVVAKDLETIIGQKPVRTNAKKAISNFKLREGLPIGVRVTLRRKRMYEFMDRFINIAVPRIRDFRGFSDKSFDGRGNYTVGIKEHIIFPEIDVDKVTKVFGMDISFVTTALTDQEAYELLKFFGLPFVKRQETIEQPKTTQS